VLLVYKKALTKETLSNAYDNYYMALGEQLDWKTIASAFAGFLHKQKKITSPDPKQVTFEEAGFLNR